jgi:tetratricopeptide (TPR) repeat protein
VRAIGLIAIALIINLGFLTAIRASTWSSPFQLAVALTDANPGSSRAALDLARRYMAMSQGNPDSPFYSMSIKELERAARLPSASPLPEEALLLAAADRPGMPTQPWWDSLRLKLQTKALQPDTYVTLHKLMAERVAGKTGIDAEQLASAYAIAIARSPSREGLRVEYAELAGTALQDPTLASEQWRQALRMEKDVPGYTRRLAAYLLDNHRAQEALAVITQAKELQPALNNDAPLIALQGQAEAMLSRDSATKASQQPQNSNGGTH